MKSPMQSTVHILRSTHIPRSTGAGLLASLSILLLSTACVTKSSRDALQAELDACQSESSTCATEREELDQELADLQEEQNRVLEEWRGELGISGDGTDAFRNDVQGQVDVIKNRLSDELPDMVRAQLGKDLEELTSMLDTQFSDIDQQYGQMLNRLVKTQESLEDANRSLERAEIRLDAIQSTGAAIRQDIAAQRLDSATLAAEVSAVAAQIEDFNYRYFLCKDCPEYLGIRRKRQNEIMAFHDELLSSLRRVTGVAAEETPVEDASEGDLE
ncbi:MAG: hypothetical protein AAGA81_00180 [Acidobacteriota bacterium]